MRPRRSEATGRPRPRRRGIPRYDREAVSDQSQTATARERRRPTTLPVVARRRSRSPARGGVRAPHWEGLGGPGRLSPSLERRSFGCGTPGRLPGETSPPLSLPGSLRDTSPGVACFQASGGGASRRRSPGFGRWPSPRAITRDAPDMVLSPGLISHGGDRHSRRGATDHALPVRPHPERSEGARPRGHPSAPLLESGPGTQVAQTAFRLGFRAMARHPRQ